MGIGGQKRMKIEGEFRIKPEFTKRGKNAR